VFGVVSVGFCVFSVWIVGWQVFLFDKICSLLFSGFKKYASKTGFDG
jgi:hypothetical protein